MKVCVVGQGPSAKDKGALIDACDFVVRMMGFWAYGAENAGGKTDALAYFGWGHWVDRPPLDCEHWYTHTWAQASSKGVEGWQRLEFLSRAADLRPIRWVTEELWHRAADHLGSYPSTGFVAVCIAMEALRPAELVLFGFDSTKPDRPNYADARRPVPRQHIKEPPHDVLAEKRALAEIGKGTWLGQPRGVKLTWPDMPRLD